MTFPTADFLRNLRFWTLHCSITALPSFLIAGFLLRLFQKFAPSLAMVTGVFFFILAYTTLSTFVPTLNDRKTLFSRALRIALKIRIGLSAAGVIGLAVPYLLLFHPDYWAGMLAKGILETGYRYLGPGNYDLSQSDHFLAILLWTITEGLILSFLLIFLSFFSLLIVNRQQKVQFTPPYQ